MWLFLILGSIGIMLFIGYQRQFGKRPSGARLARVQASSHYTDGAFRNQVFRPRLTEGVSLPGLYLDFLFSSPKDAVPPAPVPSRKTDLHQLGRTEETLVWFGHSSYFIQTGGKRLLVDPVFDSSASPVPGFIRPFPGTTGYTADDMPDIDYVFITHDHWDHLDYKSILGLRQKTGAFVCGLGMGEHLEYWGVAPEKIIELDWYESADLGGGVTVYAMPAHHYSGRGPVSDQALWVSFVVQAPEGSLYFGGDSGYGPHFAEIGERFGGIDLAILENGQYDARWKYIHMHPAEVVQAAVDLRAREVFPVHYGKFCLSEHAWNEPLRRISELHDGNRAAFRLITPMIGARVALWVEKPQSEAWW